MSRHGYTDDCGSEWSMIMWRGAVASSIRGKRGQAMLRELLAALDAMPVRRLIAGQLEIGGEYCTLGALGATKGLPLPKLQSFDWHDWYIDDGAINDEELAELFNVAPALVREIMFENDDGTYYDETPEHRWARMRHWVYQHIQHIKEQQ